MSKRVLVALTLMCALVHGRPASAHEIIEVLDNLASAETRGSGSTGGTEVPTIVVKADR